MALDKLGNGVGYVYITDASNNIIINWPNTSDSVRPFLTEALVSGPLSGEILAWSLVTNTVFSPPGTNISNITVNGVSIVTGTISSNTKSTLITNTVASINSKLSSPDYTAYEVGDGNSFVIVASPSTGSTPNGYVVVVTSANSAFTATEMANGATTSGAYSTAVNGRRFYIYADVAAVAGNISGATEVTAQVIQRGSQSGIVTGTNTIATGVISPTRISNFAKLTIDTESAAASDDLTTISTTGFIDGDVVQLVAASASRVINVKLGAGAGTIVTANGVDFVTGDESHSIQLQYSSTLDQWVEIFRTPGLDFSTASIRSQSIPWPVYGVTSTVLTNGGGTITLTPGASKNYLYLSGTPSLAASWSVVGGGSPIDGDTFYVSYRAVPTLNGNTVTIFGATLTATQAVSGKIFVRATYKTATTSYDVDVYNDVTSVDWATVASVSAKEPALGNPAADGYLLSSTTLGVRTWVPNSGSSGESKCTITLSGSAYTGTVTDASPYTDGNKFLILPNANSVEGATVNLNSGGNKNIYKPGAVRINIDDLIANRWYEITYNSTLGGFEINLPMVITAEYDFSVSGGSVSSINLTNNLPVGIIVRGSDTLIETLTAPTSSGAALIEWGLGAFYGFIDIQRPYNDFIYNTSTNVLYRARGLNSFASFQITGGGSGTIDTVTLGGLNILNGTVAFTSTLTATAAAVCLNINKNPNSTVYASNAGTTVYLYDNTSKFKAVGGTLTMSATATTMTVGNFSDLAMGNDIDAYRIVGSPKPVALTITGAALTAGKLRAYIPYYVKE